MGANFKVIKPTSIKPAALTQLLNKELSLAKQTMLADFEETTATWEHKVTFQSRVGSGRSMTSVEVYTDDKIYGYVDQGTKPHVIRAKRSGGRLAFASAFSPKTQPGSIRSGAGYRGPVDTFRFQVQHPGTEARDFTKTIKERWEKLWRTLVQNAISEMARVSGHSLR